MGWIALNGLSFHVLGDPCRIEWAQEFPLGVVVVNHETIREKTNSSDVIYVGGSVGEQLVMFRTVF